MTQHTTLVTWRNNSAKPPRIFLIFTTALLETKGTLSHFHASFLPIPACTRDTPAPCTVTRGGLSISAIPQQHRAARCRFSPAAHPLSLGCAAGSLWRAAAALQSSRHRAPAHTMCRSLLLRQHSSTTPSPPGCSRTALQQRWHSPSVQPAVFSGQLAKLKRFHT